jgi:hypothetical protein
MLINSLFLSISDQFKHLENNQDWILLCCVFAAAAGLLACWCKKTSKKEEVSVPQL